MNKMAPLCIVLLCLMTPYAHGMFGKRRESKEKKDSRALLKKAQDGTPKTQRLSQKSTSAHDDAEDDALHTQLRQVFKVSDNSDIAFSTPCSSTSSSESTDPALFEEPTPKSPPTATAAHRTLMRSPKSPYHDRHTLGLMVQWLQKLPPEKIDIVGGHLKDTEKVQLIASLRSIAIAVTTNIDDDNATEERLAIDLSELVGYAQCIAQPLEQPVQPTTIIAPKPVSPHMPRKSSSQAAPSTRITITTILKSIGFIGFGYLLAQIMNVMGK